MHSASQRVMVCILRSIGRHSKILCIAQVAAHVPPGLAQCSPPPFKQDPNTHAPRGAHDDASGGSAHAASGPEAGAAPSPRAVPAPAVALGAAPSSDPSASQADWLVTQPDSAATPGGRGCAAGAPAHAAAQPPPKFAQASERARSFGTAAAAARASGAARGAAGGAASPAPAPPPGAAGGARAPRAARDSADGAAPARAPRWRARPTACCGRPRFRPSSSAHALHTACAQPPVPNASLPSLPLRPSGCTFIADEGSCCAQAWHVTLPQRLQPLCRQS